MKLINYEQAIHWIKKNSGENRTFRQLRIAIESIESLDHRNEIILCCAFVLSQVKPNAPKVWIKLRQNFFNFYLNKILILYGYGGKIKIQDVDQFVKQIKNMQNKGIFKKTKHNEFIDILYAAFDTGYSRKTFGEWFDI